MMILATSLLAGPARISASADTFPASTLDSIDAGSSSAHASHCGSVQCKSLETIAQAMDILMAAQATSMGVTTPVPANRDQTTAKRLNLILLNHPEEFGPVCDALSKLAHQYPPGDLFVAVGSMQLAIRMDLKTRPSAPGGCLSKLLDAFPESTQAETAITNARILCANAWNLGAACARLHR